MIDTTVPENRWQTICDIWKKFRFVYEISGGLLLVLIFVAIGAVMFAGDGNNDYGMNIYTDIISVILTIFVLDRLQDRRDTQNRIKDLQEQLIREAGSSVNPTARTAVDTLRKRGWLGRRNMERVADDELALLRKVNLTDARLEHTKLNHVDMRDTKISYAGLNGADMQHIRLGGASLEASNLSNANLFGADLHNANLMRSIFIDSNLVGANLKGANLENAKLKNAIIQSSTQFDETTTLPDGTKWSPQRNLAEFGAETRTIEVHIPHERDKEGHSFNICTFADGTERRWQRGKGWLNESQS